MIVYLTAVTGPGAAGRLAAELAREGQSPTAGPGVAGDAEDVARAVRTYAEAGADTVVLQSTADEEDPEGFVRFVAEEVGPRL